MGQRVNYRSQWFRLAPLAYLDQLQGEFFFQEKELFLVRATETTKPVPKPSFPKLYYRMGTR